MAKQTIELEVPDGWELTGEFRRAMSGEAILDNTPLRAVHVGLPMGTEGPRLILRKIEPVRESRWGWICCVNESLERARAMKYGCPVVRADYEDGKLVNVALEPAEGER